MIGLECVELAPIVNKQEARLAAFGTYGKVADEIIANAIKSINHSYEYPARGAILKEARIEDELTSNVFSLNRVAPDQAYMIRVKYRFAGAGEPRPYPSDDQE